MIRNIRDPNWMTHLWQRIASLFSGLDARVTALEEGGGGGGGGAVSGVKGNEESTYRTGNVNLTPANIGAIATSAKGAASGVAELDSGGKVPTSQLPSYVDDVLEYASQSAFPSTGETGKIYVALDTNLTYRWSGSAYVEISPSLALGETSSTAYRGDRGKAAYDHAQAKGSAFASGLYLITTNAEGHVTAAVAVQKSDITALGIAGADDIDILRNALNYAWMTGQAVVRNKVDKESGKGLSSNDFADTDKTKLDGIEAGAQVNTVTGVKGDSESGYRTGNVNITKSNIGLGNVNNTSDANKPISTATQAALDEDDRDAFIDRTAMNYAYMIMQAELRDVQKRLETAEAQIAAMGS